MIKHLAISYWQGVTIIILLVVIWFQFNKTEKLELKAKEHEIKAKHYYKLYEVQMQLEKEMEASYDSLLQIKNKINYHEKIKVVNKYSVSDMQRYFNERTK
jgi:hypothetical protein